MWGSIVCDVGLVIAGLTILQVGAEVGPWQMLAGVLCIRASAWVFDWWARQP